MRSLLPDSLIQSIQEAFDRRCQQHIYLKSCDTSWFLNDRTQGFSPGYLQVKHCHRSRVIQLLSPVLFRLFPFSRSLLSTPIMTSFSQVYAHGFQSKDRFFMELCRFLSDLLQAHWSQVLGWSFTELSCFLQDVVRCCQTNLALPEDLFSEHKKIQNEKCRDLYLELNDRLHNHTLAFPLLIYIVTKANGIDSTDPNWSSFLPGFIDEIGEYLDHPDLFSSALEAYSFFEYRSLHYVSDGKPCCFLYELDNHGECLFDALFINYLLMQGHRVIVSVKDSPVLNDVTFKEWQVLCQSDLLSSLVPFMDSGQLSAINSGSSQGIKILPLLSNAYQEAYSTADYVFSKGQGHFESFPRQFKQGYLTEQLHGFLVKSQWVQRSLSRVHKTPSQIMDVYLQAF